MLSRYSLCRGSLFVCGHVKKYVRVLNKAQMFCHKTASDVEVPGVASEVERFYDKSLLAIGGPCMEIPNY